MLRQILATSDTSLLTIARIALGVVLFPHGAQKLLGWFGGYGFNGTMGYFTGTVKLPYIIGLLVILVEFFGSLGLITGLLTRVSALGILGLFIGIIFIAHTSNGFFMNWSGQQAGEGYEYHILAIGLALIVLVGGAGSFSLDTLLAERL